MPNDIVRDQGLISTYSLRASPRGRWPTRPVFDAERERERERERFVVYTQNIAKMFPEEISKEGERLWYRLLSGAGPETGWVVVPCYAVSVGLRSSQEALKDP
eukprot:4888139-Heterocapsa_arctica.AAC.1